MKIRGLLLALAGALAFGQNQSRVAVLEIEVENSVVYRYDTGDPALLAMNPAPTPAAFDRAFMDSCQVDDVVRVNGRPAKGLHMTCLTRMGFSPTAASGFAIADVSQGGGRWQCTWELLSSEGRFVGRFVDGGFFPHAILGGAGAFFGATGEHHFVSLTPARVASATEDPSKRRINGGGSYKVIYYLVPHFWPEVVMLPQGPAIFHGDDFGNPVETNKPAEAGEVLVLMAKGLGPTLPGPIPPGAKPFSSEPPYNEVNSPVEVKVNGVEAEVLNKIGWPGSLDTYRVDFRLPPGTAPGEAAIQLNVAWIDADPVQIRVR